jgi:hypothetical protein
MTSLPLFDDAPVPGGVPPLRRLQVAPQAGATLSAAARAYNLQLARIGKLKDQLAQMEALSLAHRQALAHRVHPLTQRHQRLMKDMALWLDAQLTHPPQTLTLTPVQRQSAGQIVCSLALQLVQAGQPDMAAVHDRHSPTRLADIERAHAQRTKAELEAMMGETFMADDPEASLADVIQAAKARMQATAAQEEAAREATAARRKAKKEAKNKETGTGAKAPNAAQALQHALQGDADTSLRTLYRQLAGALHPDREPDEHERLRKTALMSEANAAYARKDIVTLMDIQQRVALANPQAVANLSDDKLNSLTLLVKAQVAELERQRARTQAALCHEFDVDSITAQSLQIARLEDEEELADAVLAMEEDLSLVQQPAGLKRWLTQQHKLSQLAAREQARHARLHAQFQEWADC